MNIVIITSNSKYQQQQRILSLRSQYWAQQGHSVVFLNMNHPKFLSDLFDHDKHPQTVIFWGPFYSIFITLMGNHTKGLSTYLTSPSVGHIGDHPFAEWLARSLELNKNLTFIGREVKYKDALQFLLGHNSIDFRLIDAIQYRPIELKHSVEIIDHSKREIDFLVPMDFRQNTPSLVHAFELLKTLKIKKSTFDKICNEMIVSLDVYPLDIVVEHLSSTQIKNIQFNPQNKHRFLSALHILDMQTRKRRRIDILKKTIDLNPQYQFLVLSSEVKALAHYDNIVYLGPQRFDDYSTLLANSKNVVFSSPTYPNVINERYCDAILYQTNIMSDVNTSIKNLPFSEKLKPHTFIHDQINTRDSEMIDFFNHSPTVAERLLHIFEGL